MNMDRSVFLTIAIWAGWPGWRLSPSPSLRPRSHQWLAASFPRRLSEAKFACFKTSNVEMRRFTRRTCLRGFSLPSRYFMPQGFFTEWPGISMVNAREAKCAQLGNIGEMFWDWNPLFGRECPEAAFSFSKTLSELSLNTIWADGTPFMPTSLSWTVWSICSTSQYLVLPASKTYQVFPTHQEMLSSMCHGRRSGSQEDQKTNSRTRFELQARAPRFWSQKGSRSPWCEKLSTLPLEQRNNLSQSIGHQTHFAKTRIVISGFQNLLMSERMQAQTGKNKKPQHIDLFIWKNIEHALILSCFSIIKILTFISFISL